MKKKQFIIFGVWIIFAIIIMRIIITISENNFRESWEEKNNLNPIKSSIDSSIDSIGREGRQSYFRLSDGKEFVIDIKPDTDVFISTFLSIIDNGDSLIKAKESKEFTIIKAKNRDTITFTVRNESSDYD